MALNFSWILILVHQDKERVRVRVRVRVRERERVRVGKCRGSDVLLGNITYHCVVSK